MAGFFEVWLLRNLEGFFEVWLHVYEVWLRWNAPAPFEGILELELWLVWLKLRDINQVLHVYEVMYYMSMRFDQKSTLKSSTSTSVKNWLERLLRWLVPNRGTSFKVLHVYEVWSKKSTLKSSILSSAKDDWTQILRWLVPNWGTSFNVLHVYEVWLRWNAPAPFEGILELELWWFGLNWGHHARYYMSMRFDQNLRWSLLPRRRWRTD